MASTRQPRQLLENLPAYSVALVGKSQLRRERSGTQKLDVLVEGGRRLTAVDFVAFAALFKDVMERAVAPWVASTQQSSLEPWVLCRKFDAQTSTLQAYRELVRLTRYMLRILVLLRSHASLEDITAFIKALVFARPSQFFTGGCFSPVSVIFLSPLPHTMERWMHLSAFHFEGNAAKIYPQSPPTPSRNLFPID